MDFERKKMVSKVEEIDASCVSPEFDLIHGIQTRLVKATLILSLSTALVLLSLHQPSGDGKTVPPLIFQGFPSAFDAFVICIIFSFTGSFSWLLMANNPKLARFCRCYFIVSMLFMTSALSMLASALFLQNFRLASRLSGWY
ncbi:hypothetical protein EZV62_001336 [Acer yangbiense]|uniref:PGG domain-containing protein n=1 Tax=Acer yangbiense TaxID=1000413 RepID=A0A5C7ITU6_9ROSI|nr:hypothetical protein EZV62_001336 [Acer yangbiense]